MGEPNDSEQTDREIVIVIVWKVAWKLLSCDEQETLNFTYGNSW